MTQNLFNFGSLVILKVLIMMMTEKLKVFGECL